MEILTRLFPYTKTVAGLKAALVQILRFKEPTTDAGRKAAHIPSADFHREIQTFRPQRHTAFIWSVVTHRRSSRSLFTLQLAGMMCQLMSVTIAEEKSVTSTLRDNVSTEIFV